MQYFVIILALFTFPDFVWSGSVVNDDVNNLCEDIKSLAEKGKASASQLVILVPLCGISEQELFKYDLIAAENGFPMSQNAVGIAYVEGKFVKKDYSEAAKWYRKAAEQGESDAQHNLAILYVKGHGVHQDYDEAFKWMYMAAQQGKISSQIDLGKMYYKGIGTQKDYKQAFVWRSEAAEQGDKSSQAHLATSYALGQGVLQDYVMAHMWSNIAARDGDEEYINLRGTITTLMTPAQLEEAQRLARDWVASH